MIWHKFVTRIELYCNVEQILLFIKNWPHYQGLHWHQLLNLFSHDCVTIYACLSIMQHVNKKRRPHEDTKKYKVLNMALLQLDNSSKFHIFTLLKASFKLVSCFSHVRQSSILLPWQYKWNDCIVRTWITLPSGKLN